MRSRAASARNMSSGTNTNTGCGVIFLGGGVGGETKAERVIELTELITKSLVKLTVRMLRNQNP